MMIICEKCKAGFEPDHDGRICRKCMGFPRIIWEGKGWSDGQEVKARAILSSSKKVDFEVTRDKDCMGTPIWKYLHASPPDQFIRDAAAMMDTALPPNRRGGPSPTDLKLFLVSYTYGGGETFQHAVRMTQDQAAVIEDVLEDRQDNLNIINYTVSDGEVMDFERLEQIFKEEGLIIDP